MDRPAKPAQDLPEGFSAFQRARAGGVDLGVTRSIDQHLTLRSGALLAASGLLLLGCQASGPSLPRPVDPISDEWEEEDGIERKHWIDELHGSAPGVDWRVIERSNDEAERLRRSERRAAGLAPSAPGVWTEIGSRNQSGQTRCAALAPDGSLLLGSANGGLWRAPLGVADWRPLSDDLGGGVDEVEAFAIDGDEVLVLRRGRDVFHSIAGGSWKRSAGLDDLVGARRLVRRGPELFLLGQSAGTSGPSTVLLASTDGGASFVPRWQGSAWDGDLAVDPGSNSLVLLHDTGLWRSDDDGQSFDRFAGLGAEASGGRLALGGNPVEQIYTLLEAGDEHRLAALDAEGVLRDHGTMVDSFGTLASLASDADTVFVGGMELWRSEAAGEDFAIVNAWTDYYTDPEHALHADVRGFDVLRTAAGTELALAHTDGGTYLSQDGGASWRNLCGEGLGVGQVYDTLSDARAPERLAMGTQDQGFQVGLVEASSTRESAGPSTDTEQLLSGDYGYLVSGERSHQRLFASYPDFVLIAHGVDGAHPALDRSPLPRGAKHAWMPPLVADPNDPQVCFLLGDRLHRYAPGRTGRYRSKVFGEGRFSAGEAGYLVAMDFSPADAQRAVAADDAGGRHFSRDGGLTWSSAVPDGASAEGFRPNVVAAHPRNRLVFAVGGSGYGGPAARWSRDGGATWVPMGSGLPRTLVLDLAWFDADTLYAATEAGPFRWRRGTDTWEPLAGDLAPATTYWSVEALPSAGLVRYGTYGRGVWDFEPAGDRPVSR